METEAEAAAVQVQLTGVGSRAMLSEDKKVGRFSLAVTAGETSDGYEQYTLATSDYFNISENSLIELWLKPGSGAEWIEFYTDGALITCDENGDGRFELTKDFESGVWLKVTLDLQNTNPQITQGHNLVVRTDANSTWLFDGLISKNSRVRSVDLNSFVNDKTEIRNGRMEYKQTTGGNSFDIGRTVLVSDNRVLFQKTFDTSADFKAGEVSGGATISDGSLIFSGIDLCTGGTAISGGNSSSNVASRAFDDSTSTAWTPSQSGSNIPGNAYIGYSFGTDTPVYGFSIIQGISTTDDEGYTQSSGITSAHIQYYSSNGEWVNICTTDLIVAKVQNYRQIVYFAKPITASKFRILANSTVSSWWVYEVEFFDFSSTYTSNPIDISSASKAEYGKISYQATDKTNWNIEVSFSMEGGEVWNPWTLIDESGVFNLPENTELPQDYRLKYRLSVKNSWSETPPKFQLINLELTKTNGYLAPLEGKLQSISIVSDDRNTSGDVDSFTDVTAIQVSANVLAFSGNGMILFYESKNDKNLYKYNAYTGEITKLSDKYTKVNSIVVNYDGTKASFECKRISDSYAALVLYDAEKSTSSVTQITVTDYTIYAYDMSENGSLAWISGRSSNASLYYRSCESSSVTVASITSPSDVTRLGLFEDPNKIILSTGTAYTQNETGWTTSGMGRSFLRFFSRAQKAYYTTDNISYQYDVETKTSKKIVVSAANIKTVLNDGRLVVGTSSTLEIYDPATGEKTDILPAECNGVTPTYYDVSANGKVLAYAASTGFTYWKQLAPTNSQLKYLLSFDGKYSWYSFKSGAWEKVYVGPAPTEEIMESYGMTKEQITALEAKDFAPLYVNGAQIYSVDFAILFTSASSYLTPSIGAISIVTENSPNPTDLVNSEACVYTAKSTAFTGTQWRKVNRIYPIEINKNAAEFVYFIYSEGKYSYFDGSTWQVEAGSEISDLIGDMKANWTQLKLKGMTAQQVRSIPATALTSQLAYKDFSVVYCIKASDTTTEGYYSKITADYVAKLFAGTGLTLSITMIDGTTRNITGLNDVQIEDFMVWYTGRQNNRGSTVYTIKSGNENFFVNYHMIQSVTVTES